MNFLAYFYLKEVQNNIWATEFYRISLPQMNAHQAYGFYLQYCCSALNPQPFRQYACSHRLLCIPALTPSCLDSHHDSWTEIPASHTVLRMGEARNNFKHLTFKSLLIANPGIRIGDTFTPSSLQSLQTPQPIPGLSNPRGCWTICFLFTKHASWSLYRWEPWATLNPPHIVTQFCTVTGHIQQ